MSKHTPGPWQFVEDEVGRTFIADADGNHLIELSEASYIHGPLYVELAANMRLIAAAPDLLAALQRIVSEGYSNKQAEEAIAKALGEA